jgi:septum site-determining protein MinC
MSEQAVRNTAPPAAVFDMKAGQYQLPTLVLRSDDLEGLDDFLAAQIARLPSFFDQAPVAIDITGMAEGASFDGFPVLVGMLRGHGLVPVGIRGATEAQRAQAQALELAILPAARRVPPPAPKPATAAVPERAPTMVVSDPVRSGQRIIAAHGDLVLTSGVSSGAEVMAAGHIHCYGPLRGRAMAGYDGDSGARIFCAKLGAELVSIAGRYRVSEHLDNRYIGRAVQITLEADRLNFELL